CQYIHRICVGSNMKTTFTFILLFFFLGCSKSEKIDAAAQDQLPSHVKVEYKDGIKYVYNSQIPYSEDVLQLDLVLGEDEVKGVFFSGMPYPHEDHAGNIYAYNFRQEILKFSNDGEFIKKIGRKGQGPGEFVSGPIDIDFYPDNRMLVVEGNSSRFQIFSPEGKYLDGHRRPDDRPGRFAMDNKGFIYEPVFGIFEVLENPDSIESKEVPLLQRVDQNFQVVGYIGKAIIPDDPMLFTYYNSSFKGIDNNGRIIFSYLYRNRIEIYQNDQLHSVISRHINFKLHEPEAIIHKKGEDSITFSLDFEQLLRGYGMAVDSLNNFYMLVKSRGRGEDKPVFRGKEFSFILEIFNSEGWLVKSIPILDCNPNYISVGKGNKIYMNDPKNYTVIRYKAVM
ncbi:6-bladed beta-propeller, partial [candidate division KSB1 bacterium]